MPLGRYNAKRHFARTTEPPGELAARGGSRFVVQQHAARRMHYDLRLELGGVLKSWAVPKGPSLNPTDKRLAVQTEDHPVAYATFEGVIPAGEYGGGNMIVWDDGTWSAASDAHNGLIKGHLAFTLFGQKLRGAWHLLRMGGKDSNQWLLCKVEDAHASTQINITKQQPRSIYTGLEVGELVPQGSGKLAPARVSAPQVHKTRRKPSALPGDLAPQLATLSSELPKGPGWVYEVKLDGYRLMATRRGDEVRLLTRSGYDWTKRLPTIAAAVLRLGCERCIIDGELVVLTSDGKSHFAGLQQALAAGEGGQLLYCAFDLLALGEQDLQPRTLIERKTALQHLLAAQPECRSGANVLYWPHVKGAAAGQAALEAAKVHGLEGIIAKKSCAIYQMRRSPDWLKLKCVLRQEFVVGGYLTQAGAGGGLRSLCLGVYDEAGRLSYVGKVGTGLNGAMVKRLAPALQTHRSTRSPFDEGPADQGVRWVHPQVVVEVRFAQWTDAHRLRHASLLGVRDDKPATDVRREHAQTPQKALKPAALAPPPITLTHPRRLVAPGTTVTKEELAAYMQAIAPLMLPYVAHRPLSVLRCPKPDLKHNFFHKHLKQRLAGLGEVAIDGKEYAYLEHATGLTALVQLSVLEWHNWGCTVPQVESVDTIVFDLDPGEGVPAAQTVQAARTLRRVLRQLGLKSLLKATGGKGLHVVLPGISECTWAEAKAFGQLVADYVVAADPGYFVATMSKAARKGKVFIDYFRNGRANTSIAPYSTRARPGLPVARPVRWDDLADDLLVNPWDIRAVQAALAQGYSDPWLRLRQTKQPLAKNLRTEALKHALASR